ncbi:amidase domain-containing protein [Bacillus xiapuensis]|uniref:amidase domain-containing protein n=1 Tax=Bacillus xiapuensis TaxID=2014075 RepID=UPI000C23C157|nr:amidase domain-containing protein [Bacillus xiapuensis]
MHEELQKGLELRIKQLLSDKAICHEEKFNRKKQLAEMRKSKIVKVKALGKILFEREDKLYYKVHLKYLIKQGDSLYLEEEIENRVAALYKNKIVDDQEERIVADSPPLDKLLEEGDQDDGRAVFQYDRLQAVQYAERWWNSYNPAYPKFAVDCTNYISQCLHAGGAPMRGYPNRSKGWWLRHKNWSYSWSVAHALRWFLPSSSSGLRAEEAESPQQLEQGDVICYDFQGNGRFDHNVIVTAKDAQGMPLVNAHTSNSRMRYWSYEDSTAYTDNIQYKFFKIKDDFS